jgi:hypothetical protein
MVDLDEMKLDELEKVVEDLAKQLEAAMKIGDGMNSVTKSGNGVTSFSQCAQEIRKRDSCSHTEALRKARLEHPEAFAAFQNFGNISSRPVFKAAPANNAVQIFEGIVRTIQRDNPKMTRTSAMAQARRDYPIQFAAYQMAA